MKIKDLVGAGNIRVVGRKCTEVLRMSGREIQHKLFGVVSLAVLGKPTMLFEVFRHGIFAFSDVALSKSTSQSKRVSFLLTLLFSHGANRVHISVGWERLLEYSNSSASFSVKSMKLIGAFEGVAVVSEAIVDSVA